MAGMQIMDVHHKINSIRWSSFFKLPTADFAAQAGLVKLQREKLRHFFSVTIVNPRALLEGIVGNRNDYPINIKQLSCKKTERKMTIMGRIKAAAKHCEMHNNR